MRGRAGIWAKGLSHFKVWTRSKDEIAWKLQNAKSAQIKPNKLPVEISLHCNSLLLVGTGQLPGICFIHAFPRWIWTAAGHCWRGAKSQEITCHWESVWEEESHLTISSWRSSTPAPGPPVTCIPHMGTKDSLLAEFKPSLSQNSIHQDLLSS